MPHADRDRRLAYLVEYRNRPTHKAKEQVRALARAAWLRLEKARILRDAKDRPCADCDVRYPFYVMDFDHVRGEKLFAMASCKLCHVGQTLLDEIAKCDVVCANCHRKRTYERKKDKVML